MQQPGDEPLVRVEVQAVQRPLPERFDPVSGALPPGLSGTLPEHVAKQVLAAWLPEGRERLATSADQAADAAAVVGFPVALKVQSADLPHKTEAGGVRLGLGDADAVRAAYTAMLADVARQVEVELHDLEKLGQLLERATDLGVNQMGDPRLDSSKRQDLVREALAKAVVDARQNAEVIAKAAGAKLGTARTINANTEFTQPPVPMVRAMAMEAKAAGGAPYQSGEMTFNATVNVQYDLIPQ